MARHKELNDEKVLQDIYNAAVEVLARDGIDGLSIRKVCRLAGISTGTFYKYYPTKMDLMHRLIDYMENFYKNDVVPRLNGNGLDMLYDTAMAFVKRMLRRDLEYAKKFVNFDNMDTLTKDSFSQLYIGKVFYGVAQKCIDDGLVKEGYTRDDIVMMVKSICHGCVMNYTNLNGTIDAIDIADKTLKVFIEGIRK